MQAPATTDGISIGRDQTESKIGNTELIIPQTPFSKSPVAA
jgi:hypothetical protein